MLFRSTPSDVANNGGIVDSTCYWSTPTNTGWDLMVLADFNNNVGDPEFTAAPTASWMGYLASTLNVSASEVRGWGFATQWFVPPPSPGVSDKAELVDA